MANSAPLEFVSTYTLEIVIISACEEYWCSAPGGGGTQLFFR